MNIELFSKNIYLEILFHVIPNKILNYCLVCKLWNEILKYEILWKDYVYRYIDDEIIKILYKNNFKNLFIEYYQLMNSEIHKLVPFSKPENAKELILSEGTFDYNSDSMIQYSSDGYLDEKECEKLLYLDFQIINTFTLFVYVPVNDNSTKINEKTNISRNISDATNFKLTIHFSKNGFTLKNLLKIANKMQYDAFYHFDKNSLNELGDYILFSFFVKDNHVYFIPDI